MEDERKNGSEFLVTVPFDTKKWLSCTVNQFPTLAKESLRNTTEQQSGLETNFEPNFLLLMYLFKSQ